MSKTLTGAIGLVAGRMKARAENPDDEPIEGEEEETGAETEAGDTAAEGEPPVEEEDGPAAGDESDGDETSADYQRGFEAANMRAATILGSEHASRVPTLAARLAFETAMSAEDAVATMAAAAADAPSAAANEGSLASRMAAHRGGVRPEGKARAKTDGGDGALLASAQSRFARRRAVDTQ
ncbi:hypothetical protein [Oricola thermophila]|uniref:Uncharacterized protein n=1 Tax=Oricola thermophila TaxID=2742145 RepID=A0A6N1VDW1_9HYPH|nr:hypothetical protein [Oricola thermophila]QKV18723.1 hypothetical protein HTY61_09805 [Oricola thermophila]